MLTSINIKKKKIHPSFKNQLFKAERQTNRTFCCYFCHLPVSKTPYQTLGSDETMAIDPDR